MAIGTSWSVLVSRDFGFSYGGYNFTLRQNIDGYYEQINSTTARVHLRAWIENITQYSWTGTNKSWGIWCTDGVSYDTGGRTDATTLPAYTGHHLPDANGVSFDVSHGTNFNAHLNYQIPIAGYNHTVDVNISIPTFSSAPSGLAVSVSSRTYNSFTLSGSLSSWGNHTGSNQAFCLGVLSSSVSSWSGGRLEWQNLNPGETKSFSGTVNNSSVSLDGGQTIKGCGAYKVGVYARNGSGLENSTANSSIYYTPPATPSITVADDGYTLAKRKVKVVCTGADTSKNYANTVTFYYRYKKSTDTNYGSWVSMGTGSATTYKTATLNLDGSTTYDFQVLQQYQNQNSVAASASITTPAVPDQAIFYGAVNGSSKKIIKSFGSENDLSKRVIKWYGSVNGSSKRIF